MTTKHVPGSMMRRAAQFESVNHDATPSCNDGDTDSISHSTTGATSLSEDEDQLKALINLSFTRFKKEFTDLYPDFQLPFTELNTLDQAKRLFQVQNSRISELTKEIGRLKFSVKFLEKLISHGSKESERKAVITKCSSSDAINGDSVASTEQYVTVITLNDSTYGEIQKPKLSPNTALTNSKCNDHTENKASDSKNNSIDKYDVKNQWKTDNTERTKDKSEPIYLNTLESQKPSEKAAKKRPPTPPRKPKFANNRLASNNLDMMSTFPPSAALTKSDSVGSITHLPRKFTGPVQQVASEPETSLAKLALEECKSEEDRSRLSSNSLKEPGKSPPKAYLRTFSLEAGEASAVQAEVQAKENSSESTTSHSLYKDDIIYDTVAPDSDCDICDDKSYSTRDDDMETSSHEMLSRSSSTDDGLSNYVNIDYFLRKNSLGRSNSNIPARLNRKTEASDEPGEDNEVTLSSIKSIDYDQFGSNENLLSSFAAPNSTSFASFASASTTSSTSGSSLRAAPVKSSSISSDLSQSYPPNLSTFTPPIRDKNQLTFFRDSPLSEKEETSTYSNGSELNLSNISKGPSLYEKSHEEVDFYAYTDILDTIHSIDHKPDINDESITLESKSLLTGDTSTTEERPPVVRTEVDHSRHMQMKIVRSIIDSETIYLDCLKTLIQYKNALNTTTSSSDHALLSFDDLSTIFYRIPDLYQLHNTFLNGLKMVEHGHKLRNPALTADSKLTSKRVSKHSVGELFHNLAQHLSIYSDFLRNYSHALETANRCSANNSHFFEIIKSIKVASLQGQCINSLVDLLHEPIARLQKNALVLYDLLKYADPSDEDELRLLKEALRLTQNFLNEINLDTTRKLFPTQDKFKRRLVKESFIIESGSDRRKLRHLFLFNDVIACAKYKASSKQKFTFELKWFQMLNDIVLDYASDQMTPGSNQSTSSASLHQAATSNSSKEANAKEVKDGQNISVQIINLKLQASSYRFDLLMEEKRKANSKTIEKFRKKINELESELVLFLPQLKFSFHSKNNTNKVFTFFLSSEYERNCWSDAIKRMQHYASSNSEHVSLLELQRWFETCRKSINPNLGSFLLRTNKDETLRYGDLHIRILHLNHLNNKTNLFIVVEIDSYGHYFKRAITRYVTSSDKNNINQEFLLELEGTQSLRFLLYEDCPRSVSNHESEVMGEVSDKYSPLLKGKAALELTASCVSKEFRFKEIPLQEHTLSVETSFVSWSSIVEKIPPNKIYGMFGVSITQVCKKEKSKVPYLILSCINEVERRGLKEIGIYRVSGLSSDVQRLKKAFETNPRDACWLIREIDIHAVTGLLKLYLRELPESLFTSDMYQKYFEARDLKKHEEKEHKMTSLLAQLNEPNQSTVIALIEHLVVVNRYEEDNKMSLNNLATIFGPTTLRSNSSTGGSGGKGSGGPGSSGAATGVNPNLSANLASLVINTDLFTASTIDVMAQADILYFFLRRKSEGLSLTSTDREETSL